MLSCIIELKVIFSCIVADLENSQQPLSDFAASVYFNIPYTTISLPYRPPPPPHPFQKECEPVVRKSNCGWKSSFSLNISAVFVTEKNDIKYYYASLVCSKVCCIHISIVLIIIIILHEWNRLKFALGQQGCHLSSYLVIKLSPNLKLFRRMLHALLEYNKFALTSLMLRVTVQKTAVWTLTYVHWVPQGRMFLSVILGVGPSQFNAFQCERCCCKLSNGQRVI